MELRPQKAPRILRKRLSPLANSEREQARELWKLCVNSVWTEFYNFEIRKRYFFLNFEISHLNK